MLRGRFAPGEERPERADRLMAGLADGQATRWCRRIRSGRGRGWGSIASTICASWRKRRRNGRRWRMRPMRCWAMCIRCGGKGRCRPPSSGGPGWYMQDMACGIGPQTWVAVCLGHRCGGDGGGAGGGRGACGLRAVPAARASCLSRHRRRALLPEQHGDCGTASAGACIRASRSWISTSITATARRGFSTTAPTC